ncbi:MAG: hypothetical protein IJ715_01035 [Bacilli bacterium]|nr:hypothetical protein [Bacilli bacterium]
MKSIIRNNILWMMIGMLICGSGYVIAASFAASDIKYSPKDKNWKVSNVGAAIDDLYRNNNCVIYPNQKFVITKDINGNVYTLKIFDDVDNLVYSTTYDCDIWGAFEQIIKTYQFRGKTYTITANGSADINNFRAIINVDGKDIYTVLGYASRDNGSWDTNTTVETGNAILYNGNFYYKK